MTNEKRFYTYAFLRRDGTPYYIGKGTGKRCYDNTGRRVCKRPRDKSRILILKKGLTEGEAFKHEIYMIAVYGRKDLGTGILRNLTDGGEGMSNPAERVRKKLRINAKKHGKEFGKAAKLRTQKAVELTRMSDGEVFIFDCASDAARSLDIDGGHLSAVCKGKRYSTCGYLARYQTPDVFDWGEGLSHKIEQIEQTKKDRSKKASKLKKKKIELTRVNDGEVFIFDSLKEAARVFNLNFKNLSTVCQGKRKSTGGYTARYLPEKFTD